MMSGRIYRWNNSYTSWALQSFRQQAWIISIESCVNILAGSLLIMQWDKHWMHTGWARIKLSCHKPFPYVVHLQMVHKSAPQVKQATWEDKDCSRNVEWQEGRLQKNWSGGKGRVSQVVQDLVVCQRLKKFVGSPKESFTMETTELQRPVSAEFSTTRGQSSRFAFQSLFYLSLLPRIFMVYE